MAYAIVPPSLRCSAARIGRGTVVCALLVSLLVIISATFFGKEVPYRATVRVFLTEVKLHTRDSCRRLSNVARPSEVRPSKESLADHRRLVFPGQVVSEILPVKTGILSVVDRIQKHMIICL